MAIYGHPESNSYNPSQLELAIKGLTALVMSEVSDLLPEFISKTNGSLEPDSETSVERRIDKCRDVLSGMGIDGLEPAYGPVICWLENEALDIRADVIDLCKEMQRRIVDTSEATERAFDEIVNECRYFGIVGGPNSSCASLNLGCGKGPKHTQSMSLTSTQSSLSTKQRIQEWKLSKSQEKTNQDLQKEAQRLLQKEARNRRAQDLTERRKIVEEYRKQKQDELEVESRAAVTAHLAEIKLRKEQYSSLGIAERNRERTLKYLERKTVQSSPVKVVRPRTSSSFKPSKLYHPTKSSLNRSSASLLSDPHPTLFTPYLSRYSMN